MRCRTEFPSAFAMPFDLLNRLLGSSWRDESWHNDACPTFVHDELALILYVDAERVADREFGSRFTRFSICSIADGLPQMPPLMAYDDVADLLAYLAIFA